jgi:hypothetical protein
MYIHRQGFLAQCALQLVTSYKDDADRIQQNKDGFHPARRKVELARLYNHLSDRSKLNLLEPSGGLNKALARGKPEIQRDIQTQLRKTNVGVRVGDFLLRYMAHFPNERRAASVNKAVYFIERGGYNEDFISPRHRSEIIKAWSQVKPSISFSLAAFYSEPAFLSNILERPDPSASLEEILFDDVRRECFFGIVKYCEMQLSSLVPSHSRESVINPTSGMSVINLADLCECCPILKPFSEGDCKKLSMYSAPISIDSLGKRGISAAPSWYASEIHP